MQNVVNKNNHTNNLKQRFRNLAKKALLTSAIASTLLSSTSNNITNINTTKPITNYAYAQTQSLNNQQQLDEITKKLQEFAQKKDYQNAKKYIQELVKKGVLTEIANSEKFNPPHFFFDKFLDGKKLGTGGAITYEVIKDYVFPYMSFTKIADKLNPIKFEDKFKLGITDYYISTSYPVLVPIGPHAAIFYRLTNHSFYYKDQEYGTKKPIPIAFFTINKNFPNYKEGEEYKVIHYTDLAQHYIKSYSVVIPNQNFSVDNPIAAFNVSFYLPANSDLWKVSVLPIYAGEKKIGNITVFYDDPNNVSNYRVITPFVFTSFLLNEPFNPQTTLTKAHFNNLKTVATYVTIKNNKGEQFDVPIVLLISDNMWFNFLGNKFSIDTDYNKVIPNIYIYTINSSSRNNVIITIFDLPHSRGLIAVISKFLTNNDNFLTENQHYLINYP